MPFGDGIDRKNCYALGDFHEFDKCSFSFFVKHHLQKKYEIEKGSEAATLGTILDESIKKYHLVSKYGVPRDSLEGLVRASVLGIKETAAKRSGPSFYSGALPFLTEELIQKAIKIFQDYYDGVGGKINPSLGKVDFCEWVIETPEGNYKLWGSPDTFELGKDGVAEIVDYKSRMDVEKGKQYMDRELMPKLYTMLCANQLKEKGYKKARFIVRLWQSPGDESLSEEFDLESVSSFETLFLDLIKKINETTQFSFCGSDWCVACQHEDKEKFAGELKKLGIMPSQNTQSALTENLPLSDIISS